jgi:hypothetical protein
VLHEGACAAKPRGGMRGGAARGQAGKVTWGQGGYKLEAPRLRGSVDQRGIVSGGRWRPQVAGGGI